jgi:hypothetical protein
MASSPQSTGAGIDEVGRQRHANFLTSLFGVLAGAIVFLPSILGIFRPPFAWEPLLYTFWILGVFSLVLLSLAIYFLKFTVRTTYPHRLSGLGSWFALVALMCLVLYVAANGFQDQVSHPYIQSIKINPSNPQAGDVIELSADATNENQNRLRFYWSIDGKELAQGQAAYWAVPQKAGRYNLRLRVDDGAIKHSQETTLGILVSERRQSMAKAADLINASIMRGLERVREKDLAKFTKSYAAYDASSLPTLVAKHFSPEDSEVYYQVIPQAFESAVMKLSDEDLNNLLLGLDLPPCKDYPGLWPFCKK